MPSPPLRHREGLVLLRFCVRLLLPPLRGETLNPNLQIPPMSSEYRGNPRANLRSTSYRYSLREVAFEWELTNETIYLPLDCLQGGLADDMEDTQPTEDPGWASCDARRTLLMSEVPMYG